MNTVDELIQRIHESDKAVHPLTDARYVGKPCPSCGRPMATKEAWDDFGGDESLPGDNLCWMDCLDYWPTLSAGDVRLLVAEIERLRLLAAIGERLIERSYVLQYDREGNRYCVVCHANQDWTERHEDDCPVKAAREAQR